MESHFEPIFHMRSYHHREVGSSREAVLRWFKPSNQAPVFVTSGKKGMVTKNLLAPSGTTTSQSLLSRAFCERTFNYQNKMKILIDGNISRGESRANLARRAFETSKSHRGH